MRNFSPRNVSKRPNCVLYHFLRPVSTVPGREYHNQQRRYQLRNNLAGQSHAVCLGSKRAKLFIYSFCIVIIFCNRQLNRRSSFILHIFIIVNNRLNPTWKYIYTLISCIETIKISCLITYQIRGKFKTEKKRQENFARTDRMQKYSKRVLIQFLIKILRPLYST